MSSSHASSLLEFLDSHGREPSVCSADPVERALASWLARQRHEHRLGAKPDALAESLLVSGGYSGILRRDGRESLSNRLTESLCLWMLSHGREPVVASGDPAESYLALVLARKRTKLRVYPSDHQLASSYGLPNILEKIGKPERSRSMAEAYGRWYEEHGGKRPSSRSEDKRERSLAAWMHNRVSVSRGTLRGVLYAGDDVVLARYGLSGRDAILSRISLASASVGE